MSLARGYNSDPGVDHWTVVKIILRYLKRTKEMFLGYGGDKEFVVKSYVDASFDTDLDDSKSRSRYILKVGAHQETLQFHSGPSPSGRHRDLQNTYGSECCRLVD